MSLTHAAQYLAAQGRNGDNHLVHMSSGEIRGLQDLAKLHGTSLTVNPHTGLPEAFSLKSLLPAILGAGIVAATGGAAAPWMVGLGVGGASALATGDLKKGIMAGLGAYGGAGLGTSLAEAGAQSMASEAAGQAFDPSTMATAGEGAVAAPNPMSLEQIQAMEPSAGAADVQGFQQQQMAQQQAAQQAQQQAQEAASAYQPYTPEPMPTTLTDIKATNPSISQMGEYMGQGVKSIGNSAISGTGSAALDFAKANGKSLLAAASPAIANALEPATPTPYAGDKDLGRRYAYMPGRVSPTPAPGAGGATQQYFSPSYRTISSDEAKSLYGFADGGPVENMSDANSAGQNTGFPMADISHGAYATPWQTPISRNVVSDSSDSGVDMFTGDPRGMASGGVTRYGLGGFLGKFGQINGNITPDESNNQYDRGGMLARLVGKVLRGAQEAQPQKVSYNADNQTYTKMASGGLSDLGGYSDGGRLLRGPGDGVSDSIPAVIGKKQPARLADGEFVVPARIVSELGNGSTEAGARKLYAMMNRVQQARGKTVGKDRVAKNTRADKYLPA